MAELKVLYFVGKGRSGTTMMDNVLGQVPGVVSAGEADKVWTWGFRNGWRCGCGDPVRTCTFWHDVLDAGFVDVGRPDELEVARLQDSVLRWPNVPRLLLHGLAGVGRWPALEEYVQIVSRVYQGISKVTGAELIVDSSKWPAAPTALGIVPGVDVRLLHNVRDPRAVVNSWKRRKASRDRSETAEMSRYGVTYSVASYWARNLVAEAVVARAGRRGMRIRYEDFTADPRRHLARILAHCEVEPPGDLPVTPDHQVELSTTHSAGGNPVRLRTGSVPIRPDDRWPDELDRASQVATTVLTAPLLLRYGYPLRT